MVGFINFLLGYEFLERYSEGTFVLFKDLYRDRRISNIQRRTSARWKLLQEHVESIKQFSSNSNSTAVKRRTVRLYLMRTFEDAPDVYINTIGNFMKRKWCLSYKVLEGRHAYSYTSDNIRRYFESSAIQHQLRSKGIELIFFDEFSLNSRHTGYDKFFSHKMTKKCSQHFDKNNKIDCLFLFEIIK